MTRTFTIFSDRVETGTERRIYDGGRCVADVDASGNPLRTYTWGQGIDNLLAVTVYTCQPNSPQPTASSYHAVKDHLGSVHALVDESGGIAAQFTYDAWGNVQSAVGNGPSAAGNRFLWQGREYSFATGLYNFRARWYDPATGRWLSKDPIGLEGGLNLYVFCGNDPVNMRDPWGLKLWQVDYWADKSIQGGVANNIFSSFMGVMAAMVPDVIVLDFRGTAALLGGGEAGEGYIFNFNDGTVNTYYTLGVGAGNPQKGFAFSIGIAWNGEKNSPCNKDFDGGFDEVSLTAPDGQVISVSGDANGWVGISYGRGTPAGAAPALMVSEVFYFVR